MSLFQVLQEFAAVVPERSDGLGVDRAFGSGEDPATPLFGTDSEIDIRRFGPRGDPLRDGGRETVVDEPQMSFNHLAHLFLPSRREGIADGHLRPG